MAERGRMGWQRATNYGMRNAAEAAVSRDKRLIGPRLRARNDAAQADEVVLAVQVLNQRRAPQPLGTAEKADIASEAL